MRRLLTPFLCTALALAGALVIPPSSQAAESPFAGTWKVSVVAPGQEIAIWLVKIEDKDGKPNATVLSAGLRNFKESTVEDTRVEGKTLHLTFKSNGNTFEVVAHAPKDGDKPEKLLGSVGVRGQRDFIQMERTDLKELDPEKAISKGKGADALVKAMRASDVKEKEAGLKEVLEKFADEPIAYRAGLNLVGLLAKGGAPDEPAVKAAAEGVVKHAARYGPEMEQFAISQLAKDLSATDKQPTLALDYARQAEKGLDASAPAAQQETVLKTLAAALKNAGKKEEAKAVRERLAKLDDLLDEEFLKDAVPFKPEAFAGRKGKADRVVLVELFTGAQCPPCVSADVAFDAVLQSYKPSDVILLQYHLHIPGPDALTNADSEKRAEVYGVSSTPNLYINGKEGPALGGYKQHGEERFKTLTEALAKPLEANAEVGLKVNAKRQGDKITLHAETSDVKSKSEDVRLKLVLVQDVARYPGRNGQRLHHHVVRAFPGGVEGVAVKDGAAKADATVDLAEVKKSLASYLKDHKFSEDDQPLDLKHLKVVAFIQDDKSKEVLQAIQVDIPEAK